METVFFFKNMLPMEENELREYFFTKIPKLEKILTRFPEDGVVLQVKGEKFLKHSAYDVELTMKLHGETFTARETSHAITKAVDFARDRLDMQLKKAILEVRRNHRSIKARNKMKFRVGSLG
jgi:ribosomal subunit interface protein